MSFFNLSDFITVGVLQSGPNPVLKVRKITTNAEFALKKLKTHDYQQHLINVQNSLHLAACSHPNILELLGFSVLQTKNEQLYVPEYTLCLLNELHERTLEQEILKRNEKRNNFSLQEMLDLTAQIGKALIYLQKDARICHRDIKPSNILINSQGKFILSDFTESFQENELNKNIKNIVGTAYYMAPEVKEIFIKGEENCDFNQFNPWKSDVYSFGITLLECCDLSISSKKSLEDKIKNAEKNYGEDFSNFIRILLTNDLKLRPDFIELEERVEYVKLFGKKQEKEENFQVERRENNANLAEKEANLSVSQEFELFLKEIGNNGEIDEELEKELLAILEQTKKIERENLELKQRSKESSIMTSMHFYDRSKLQEKRAFNTQ